jgi:thiol-disulfide isomerase/thioredoxin
MGPKIINHCIIILLLIFAQITFAQKRFHVTIQFPSNLNIKKIQIKYDNGKKEILVRNSFKKNIVVISDNFYSKFATLMITYPKNETSLYYNEFFISNKSSTIKFFGNKSDSTKNPLENCKLTNAVEIGKTNSAKLLNTYTLSESNDVDNFYLKYENEINSNDSFLNIYNIKSDNLNRKELEFIKKNGGDYFSFWIFRTRIINTLPITEDVLPLIETFSTIFPGEFTQTIEGREVEKYLKGRAFTKKNNIAPEFITKDITGKIITLNSFKGKLVLLNFWASWCGPCLEKVPFINKIRESYSSEKLAIIGVSYDSDSIAFRSCVEKNKMNWIHIYGDADLVKKYGNKPIPSLYLIDEKGVILYSNWEDNNDTLISLLNTLLGYKSLQ